MSENGDEPHQFVQQIIMTPEILQQLISGIQLNTGSPQTAAAQGSQGNFSGCKSRFNGKADSDVNAFIDAICVYKDCLNIPEVHALKGLSMLLIDDAATWWQGVKDSTTTFDDAITSLKHAYGQFKPPHQIYQELFSCKQGNEKTDIFISKARALLAQLKGESAVSEHVQLDMVYGLLNVHVRDKVLRDQVSSSRNISLK